MAYIARDQNKKLYIFEDKPERDNNEWVPYYTDAYISGPCIELPLNIDEKLIGKHITWNDEPVEI